MAKTLQISNLDPRVNEAVLNEIFAGFGTILAIRLLQTNGVVTAALVDFSTFNSANSALKALNGRMVLNSEIQIVWAPANISAGGGAGEDTSKHPTIFIGNLPPEFDEHSLLELFSPYNPTDSRLIREPGSGRLVGYGFMTFRDYSDAQSAVAAMEGNRILGKTLRCSISRTQRQTPVNTRAPVAAAMGAPAAAVAMPPPSNDLREVFVQTPATNTTVHVGNLDSSVTEEHLRYIFGAFGAIDNVRASGKAFAFVQYLTHEQASMAIATLQGHILNDRPMRLTWATERRTPASQTPSAGAMLQLPYEGYSMPSATAYAAYAHPAIGYVDPYQGMYTQAMVAVPQVPMVVVPPRSSQRDDGPPGDDLKSSRTPQHKQERAHPYKK